MLHDIANALMQTIYLVLLASIPVVLVGFLVSLIIYMLRRPEFFQNRYIGAPLEFIIDAVHRLPYFALVIAFIPLGLLASERFSNQLAVMLPVILACLPVYIHQVLAALDSVSKETIHMGVINGATRYQLLTRVILPEARKGLISAYGTTLIALVSCTTIAGIIGASGLGQILVDKGFRTFDANYVLAAVAALAVLNQSIGRLTKAVSN